jgi:hypothetical protein
MDNTNPFGDAPQQPTPAPMPNNTTPMGAPAPAAKKSKLGLILGLSIGGVVLIAAVVVALILLLGGGVSKQDYKDAQSAASDLRTPYSKIASFYVSTYSTDTEVKNELDTLKKNRTTFNDDFKKLGEMKAVKNDEKAQDFYKKAADQKTKLDAYLDTAVEAYEVIYPVAKEMENVSYSNSADAIATLKSYQTKLKDLKLTQQVNKDYIDEINGILPDFISALEAYANMDYSNYDSSLYTKVSNLSTKLTDADSSWKSNLTKLEDDANFSDAFNDLGEYLTDQINK